VGAITDKTPIHYNDPFFTCDYNGERVDLSRDLARFESSLCALSPADAPLIKKMCADIKTFHPVSAPVLDIPFVRFRERQPSPLGFFLKAAPALIRMLSLSRITILDYARRFQHPIVRFIFSNIVDSDYDATSLMFTMACFTTGDAGYIDGGALGMAQNMTDAFTREGGVLRCGAKIDRVVIKNGRALGIRTGDETVEADAVLITIDTITIDSLFDGGFHESWLDRMRRDTVFAVSTLFTFGIEADLSSLPPGILCYLKRPLDYGGAAPIDSVMIRNYVKYGGFAPEGCTSLTVLIYGEDTYNYWKTAKEQGCYNERKKQLVDEMASRLEEQFPLMAGKIAFRDGATPLTYERYCGTAHGSWMSKRRPGKNKAPFPYKSKKTENLYFAGQRIQSPGGLPVALLTGRTAAQYLCRDFHKVFASRGDAGI
jgi:phytoene dehydrogenase-like protein